MYVVFAMTSPTAAAPTAPPRALPDGAPTLDGIRQTRARIAPHVVETPVWRWRSDRLQSLLGDATEIVLKLELFQHAGSFKPRGAVAVMLDLSPHERSRGVTAISAGNHAIAVAYAARALGTSAKVVVPATASPARIARAEAYGAQVVRVVDVHQGFALVQEIAAVEGRTVVHPFEGARTVLGTATVGLELCEQATRIGGPLDAVIVPVGGGGLLAGIAAAVRLVWPACAVYGVEPVGADTMYRSFRSGTVERLDRVRTIADSLGAPYTMPFSLAVCRAYTDEIVLVDDDAICRAMALLFGEMKLAVEPAGATATAALCGPLRDRLRGRRVGVIVCGANIDVSTFAEYVQRGEHSEHSDAAGGDDASARVSAG